MSEQGARIKAHRAKTRKSVPKIFKYPFPPRPHYLLMGWWEQSWSRVGGTGVAGAVIPAEIQTGLVKQSETPLLWVLSLLHTREGKKDLAGKHRLGEFKCRICPAL